MDLRSISSAVGVSAVLVAGVASPSAQEPRVLLTADRGGALAPCGDCPGDTALGGADRMATLVRGQRAEGPVLLLDAGNAFFGSADAIGAPGAAVREFYDALPYDVVNVGFADFRHGLATTREVLAAASFVPVSANLRDGSGQNLFDPFALKTVAGETVAVVGVTQRPPGLDYLPHLQRQFAGISVADPFEALAEVLPQAREGADHVILLAYGDRELLDALLARFGAEVDVVAIGGLRPADLPAAETPVLAASSTEGRHVTRFALGSESVPELLEVGPEWKPDPAVQELLADELLQPSFEIEEVARPLDLDAALPKGERIAVDVRSSEPGFGIGLVLRVTSVARRASWQGLEPPEGRSWMVFELGVENDIPASLAFGGSRAAGEKLLVVQKQKLFLVCGEDGRAVLPAMQPKKPTQEELLLPAKFVLDFVGDSRTGEVAFAVHDEAFSRGPLQLRLYHDEVAPAAVDVRGEVLPDAGEAVAENAYVAFAEPVVAFPDTVDGRAPPAGARWVVATLRGRSRLAGSAATAGDKKPGGKLPFGQLTRLDEPEDAEEVESVPTRPRPAFYLEGASHLELLVDGMWARRAESGLGSLPAEPVFLPDRFTGGTAVFLAPVEVHSLELSCAFPLIKLEDGEELVMPPVRLPLEGEPVAPDPEEAAVVVDDGPLPLAVIGVERVQEVGEITAGEGRALLILDGRVENRQESGFYGPRERFLIADARPVATLDRAGLPLVEPFLVPAGGRRAFRVVLDAPADLGGPTDVTYSGVTVRPTFSLELPYEGEEKPEPAVAAPEPDAPASPESSESPESPEPPGSREAPVELGAVWREHATPVREPSWVPLAEGDRAPAIAPRTITVGDVTLGVLAGSFSAALGEKPAAEDEVFLELDLELRLAPDSELEKLIIPRILCGVLDRHRRVELHLARRRGDLATHVDLDSGAAVAGKVLFRLPRAGFDSFSLEFVPPDRAGIHVPLLEPARPFAEPLHSLENAAFGVEVAGFAAYEELEEQLPASGNVFVAVDVRARNHLASETLPAGLLAWQPLTERVQLVLDGLVALTPRKSPPAELVSDPTLLPTETTGGRLVFEVPKTALAGARSVELVCGFEWVEIPGGGLLYPLPLRFPLVGELSDVSPPKTARRCEDADCTVVVGAIDRPELVEGRETSRRKSKLTVELWFVAPEDRGVVIEPLKRCRLIDVEGGVYSIYGATWNALTPTKNGRAFWIPAGGVRRVDAMYYVPDARLAGAAVFVRGLLHASVVPIYPEEADRVGSVPALDPRRSLNGQLVHDDTLVPRGLEGVGLKPEQVNRAIDRGRDFLWEYLKGRMKDGELAGERNDYPALLALVHCDAHERYLELDQALRRFLAQVDLRRLTVYQQGLVAMIVDGMNDPELEPLFEQALMCLVEGQGPEGSWTYSPPLADRLFPEAEPPPTDPSASFTLEVTGGEPPEARDATPELIERTQSRYATKDGDNSVSQFAALGLAAAERHRLAIDPETWRGLLDAFSKRQYPRNPERGYGGWGYTGGGPYGSMTCAGMATTAIALRRFAPSVDPRKDLRIRDGLAWLDRNWTLAENPGKNDWHYYYLYGLERVGRVLDLEFIGSHEWYPEGAKYLVDAQSADGSWPGKRGEADPRLATSFALLFLTRATESLELDEREVEEPEGPGELLTSIELPPGTDNVYVILDGSGSMLSEIDGQRKFDIARAAVRRLIAKLPDEAQFALRVYGHRLRAIEDGADDDTELLVPFTPLDKQALFQTLETLRPRGKTPLTLSLDEALRDLSGAPAGRDTQVILLTDGGEDTRKDPVAAAEKWAGRKSARLWVVGFDIDRPAWTEQLHAIAAAAGGQYVQVERAAELADRVAAVVVPEPPEFEVRDEQGAVVARGRFGDDLPLEPGAYTVAFRFRDEEVSSSIWVEPGDTVRLHLDATQPAR